MVTFGRWLRVLGRFSGRLRRIQVCAFHRWKAETKRGYQKRESPRGTATGAAHRSFWDNQAAKWPMHVAVGHRPTEQDKARQDKAGQGKARQGKTRQGKARQGKARQGKAKEEAVKRLTACGEDARVCSRPIMESPVPKTFARQGLADLGRRYHSVL